MERCGNRDKCGQYLIRCSRSVKSFHLSSVLTVSFHCRMWVLCSLYIWAHDAPLR